MLVDLQSGNDDRGVCGLPFTRQSDGETVYIPMNIIGNLYVSNGMSAGNTANEARVQALSEVFERHIKNRIIAESISLRRSLPK
nr:YcaO-like family [Raoultella sp. NCTC 9187]